MPSHPISGANAINNDNEVTKNHEHNDSETSDTGRHSNMTSRDVIELKRLKKIDGDVEPHEGCIILGVDDARGNHYITRFR